MTDDRDAMQILDDKWPDLEVLSTGDMRATAEMLVSNSHYPVFEYLLARALYTILSDQGKVQTLQQCATDGCENRFSGQTGRSVAFGDIQICAGCAGLMIQDLSISEDRI